MAKPRIYKIADRSEKKYGLRTGTPEEAKVLFDAYIPGMRQQMKGEVTAVVIERFLAAEVSERNRASLEASIRELHRCSNFKRFRTKALNLFMLGFQNGAASGAPFDLIGLIRRTQDELAEKYRVFEEEEKTT